VTDATGATDADYTYAAACADLDGDGAPDLYLCNAGRDRILRNDVKRRPLRRRDRRVRPRVDRLVDGGRLAPTSIATATSTSTS
jgi:hypothetical protein